MSQSRIWIGIVFLVGCVAGGVSSQLVAPSARADVPPRRWEHFCFTAPNAQNTMNDLNVAGSRGWELVTANSTGSLNENGLFCMKRPMP